LRVKLAHQLLLSKDVRHIDELLPLGEDGIEPVESDLLRQVAKIYVQDGDLRNASETLNTLYKANPQCTDTLRGLFDLAEKEGRIAEAHSLLNQLIQVDPSLATVTFAYKQRTKLPQSKARSVRVALLSSYVLDQLIPYLDFECRSIGLAPEFYVAPFNQYAQEILNPSSGLYHFNPEIVFLALAVEDLFGQITGYPSVDDLNKAAREIHELVLMVVRELQERCGALIVVTEFSLMHHSPHGILDNKNAIGLNRWVEELNHVLERDFQSHERAFLFPLNQVLSWVGKDQSNNPKMRFMASMRVGEAALPELAKYSMRYVKPLKGLTRKCIVLDLDGTLWGGIVGESGIEGIHLGPTAPGVEYMDFQKALLSLTRRGILLAICSKNNPDDVLPVIRDHKYMLLGEVHFSAMRINWCNKADNLREIAEELNIGLDSMVFVDDNPAERELIRQLLPEVLTVELPKDPSRYRMTLEKMSDFEQLSITEEDEMRVLQYSAERKRRSGRSTAASLEQYLHSLKIKTEVTFATPNALSRLVQMFNKTNQFNLMTRRYQAAEMKSFLESQQHLIYMLRAQDRFGDHGVVGAAIIEKENRGSYIAGFLMSCRVMGLSVETALLQRIYEDACNSGARTLRGEFIRTNKNQPVEEFYSKHGFSLIKDVGGHQLWELDIMASTIEMPKWITMVGVETL